MSIIFISCVLFIFYVYLGYPLFLFLSTYKKTIPLPSGVYTDDISILMVVCNEEKSIGRKIENLLSLNCHGNKKIVIVDDNSDDDTCNIIKQYKDKIHLIQSPERLGKANGINIGISAIDTELVLMVDCRQRIEKNALVYLSSWFLRGSNIGAVSGELMFELEDGSPFSDGMDGYWKYEKFIRKSEAKFSSVPGVTGAIYMLRRELFKKLPIDTLLDDVQIPMDCSYQGYRVVFDERAIAWDRPSTSSDSEKLRKIRTLSGNYQLVFRNPSWIMPGCHPLWWQFFSHKIARLIAPFVAILTIYLSWFLYQNNHFMYLIYFILTTTGVLLLPISLLYPNLISNKIIKILSSFLILNWFCVLAAFRYFLVGSKGAWKR